MKYTQVDAEGEKQKRIQYKTYFPSMRQANWKGAKLKDERKEKKRNGKDEERICESNLLK